MQQVQLNVSDEMKAAGDMIGGLIADIVAKKPIATIAADALPSAMQAISGLGSMGADIKLPDNQAYLLYKILQAFEPAAAQPAQPVPAP